MAIKKNANQVPRFRVNGEIRSREVRIVGEGIDSRVVSLLEARQIANDMGVDLVEINPKASIPVVRAVDYGKMVYELKKAAKKNKQHGKQLKEIQLSVSIAEHDLDTKVSRAKKFIEDGSKVKVVLTMRGRELARRNENKKSILEFITRMDDVAVPESMPRDEGNKTIVILKKKG